MCYYEFFMKSDNKKKHISLLLILTVLAVISAVVIVGLAFFQWDKRNSLDTFEECVSAGYPILESYPAQCNTPWGAHFTEVVAIPDQGSSTDGSDAVDYYGSSSYGACSANEDCESMGCNSEVCGLKGESGDLFSTCQFPEDPLPEALGYNCGCENSECQWTR